MFRVFGVRRPLPSGTLNPFFRSRIRDPKFHADTERWHSEGPLGRGCLPCAHLGGVAYHALGGITWAVCVLRCVGWDHLGGDHVLGGKVLAMLVASRYYASREQLLFTSGVCMVVSACLEAWAIMRFFESTLLQVGLIYIKGRKLPFCSPPVWTRSYPNTHAPNLQPRTARTRMELCGKTDLTLCNKGRHWAWSRNGNQGLQRGARQV